MHVKKKTANYLHKRSINICVFDLQFQPEELRATIHKTIHSLCLWQDVIPTLYTQSPLFTFKIPQMPAADSVGLREGRHDCPKYRVGYMVGGRVTVSISIDSMTAHQTV